MPRHWLAMTELTAIRCSAGLTTLDQLMLLPPYDDPDDATNSSPLLADVALRYLTRLTCLQYHVSVNCMRLVAEHARCYMHCLRMPRVRGVEP
jgi:hypothetical protein